MIPPHFMASTWQTTDVIAHAGGALVGLVSAFFLRRQQKQEIESYQTVDREKEI